MGLNYYQIKKNILRARKLVIKGTNIAGSGHKILGLPNLAVTMTCVRVPVDVGHCAAIFIETEQRLSAVEAHEALDAFPGVRVFDDRAIQDVPTPASVAGSDDVWVGRVREDLDGHGLWLWQVVDNLRKGAATNALQIAEALIERRLA